MKTCQYCMGEIPEAAVKCMHCGEHLTRQGRNRAAYTWTPGRLIAALLILGPLAALAFWLFAGLW